jgi:hypothetical protein
MNRIGLFVIGVALAFVLPTIAQDAATVPAPHMPTVDQHLSTLSEKLDLNAKQQKKARPIVAEMQDAMQKVMSDSSLTHGQALAEIRSAQMKADAKLRRLLSEEQQRKLSELESDSHMDLHEKQ